MNPPGAMFRRRLTDAEVDDVRAVTKQHGSSAGFHRLWEILLGMTWDEALQAGVEYSVRDYAIPADQDALLQRILSVPPSRAGRLRWTRRQTGMQFLIHGPAMFDE